jgi:hypothetical protein
MTPDHLDEAERLFTDAMRERDERVREGMVLRGLASLVRGLRSSPPPAPPAGVPSPIPMVLTCPSCSARHIDEGEFATKVHHTHSCQGCGLTWRPAVVPTVGVQFLPGFKNEPGPTAGVADESAMPPIVDGDGVPACEHPRQYHDARSNTDWCPDCGAIKYGAEPEFAWMRPRAFFLSSARLAELKQEIHERTVAFRTPVTDETMRMRLDARAPATDPPSIERVEAKAERRVAWRCPEHIKGKEVLLVGGVGPCEDCGKPCGEGVGGPEWTTDPKPAAVPRGSDGDDEAVLWSNVKSWLLNTAWQNGWKATAETADAEQAFDFVAAYADRIAAELAKTAGGVADSRALSPWARLLQTLGIIQQVASGATEAQRQTLAVAYQGIERVGAEMQRMEMFGEKPTDPADDESERRRRESLWSQVQR